jgi:hypothetical protein
VAVPVMKIRIVRMGVDHRLMPVPMRMQLHDRPIVLVLCGIRPNQSKHEKQRADHAAE